MSRAHLAVAAFAWAAVGGVVALVALQEVNVDARVLVLVASIAFPLCAVFAGVALQRGAIRLSGVLLIASAAAPRISLGH